MELPDIPYIPVPEIRSLLRRKNAQATGSTPNLSSRRPIQRSQQVQQGTLTCTALPNDGDHLAGMNDQIQTAKELQFSPSRRSSNRGIGLRQSLSSQHYCPAG